MQTACPLTSLFSVCEPTVNVTAVTHLRNVEIQGHCISEGQGREENVKMFSLCPQKPGMLSKPRSMEREAKFNQSILELLSVSSLLEEHLIFLYGTN